MRYAISIELFRPSNGTEGEIFISGWCARCARDRMAREGADWEECDDSELCEILTRTLACVIDDPDYPQEWRYDETGEPCCTAFIPAGDPVPEPRCSCTMDLFA